MVARDPGTETWQSSKTLEMGGQWEPRSLLTLPGLWGPLLAPHGRPAHLLVGTCSLLASWPPQRAPAVRSLTVSARRCSWPSPPGCFSVGLCSHSRGKKSDGTAAPFVTGQLVLCILSMCSLPQSTVAGRIVSCGIF